MERVYLQLSHYHTEYTAVRCRLVVLCCDAVLDFLEREALQQQRKKIGKGRVTVFFTLQNKDAANPTLQVLGYFGCTAWGVLATQHYLQRPSMV